MHFHTLLALALLSSVPAWAAGDFFKIKVIDAQTGRGVPLAVLETENHIVHITDSAGLIAFHEPGLMDRPVFFHVRSHGYEYAKDGFGYAGLALTPRAGQGAEVKLRRRNIAERLYRITGAGIYRDSVLLGEPVPLREPVLDAQVLGQDSTLAAVFGGKIFWIWGDTQRASYPLGNFAMSGATSALPSAGGLPAGTGIDLEYFTGKDGFARGMWERPDKGVIWSDGLLAVKDATGRERLIAHAAHLHDISHLVAHRLSVFDEKVGRFETVREYPIEETWRCPLGHPVRVTDESGDWFYFRASRDSHAPFPAVRVRATFDDVRKPGKYEAFTCLAPGTRFDKAATQLARAADGRLLYAWRTDTAPLTAEQERELIAAGKIKPDEARFQPRDVEGGKAPHLHAGSVNWNAFRKKWVLIASQLGGTSQLGEVWYAEADTVLGPWPSARKILTHDRYSFYNPVHHAFLDEQDGRIIYFEGTYTNTFSGNPEFTPRYDYNQIMHRLDLGAPWLGQGG